MIRLYLILGLWLFTGIVGGRNLLLAAIVVDCIHTLYRMGQESYEREKIMKAIEEALGDVWE